MFGESLELSMKLPSRMGEENNSSFSDSTLTVDVMSERDAAIPAPILNASTSNSASIQ